MKKFALSVLIALAPTLSMAAGLVQVSQSCTGQGLNFVEIDSENNYFLAPINNDELAYFADSSDIASENSEVVFNVLGDKKLSEKRNANECYEHVSITSEKSVRFSGMSAEVANSLNLKNGDVVIMKCDMLASIKLDLSCE